MYCQNCGRDIGDANFCPVCGAAQNQSALRVNSDRAWIIEKYRYAFSDPLFLVLCLLYTVSVVIDFVMEAGEENSILIFTSPLLFAVALWLLFFSARSSGGGFSTGGFTVARIMMSIIHWLIWLVSLIFLALTVGMAVMPEEIIREVFDNFIDEIVPLGSSVPTAAVFSPSDLVGKSRL